MSFLPSDRSGKRFLWGGAGTIIAFRAPDWRVQAMSLGPSRFPVLARVLSMTLLSSFVLTICCPQPSMATPEDQTIYEKFEEVSSLRSQGQYEQAIEILQGIIIEYSGSEEILRRAYSDLVFTLLSKEDIDTAAEIAKGALYRFPDLKADPVYFPPRVDEVYDDLRSRIFGSLNVATRPESCSVFLGDEFVGFSPLSVQYVRVGEYALKATKPGHNDEITLIHIEPGQPTSVPLSLQRDRGRTWWLLRVGPAVLVTGVLLALQLRGEKTSEPSQLPGPPPPPGQ